MKSFKSLVSEVAQPKPEEEKRFKDQHKVDIAPHPTATEFQHKGTVKPKAKRIADQEGDANYDQAYTVKEEAEELDEISRDLARRYIRKVADKTNTGELSTKEVMKRRPGVNLAGKKAYPGVAGEPKVRATESVDLEEDITKMSHGRLKFHMNSGVPHGSYTKDEMKKEKERRLKTDPMGYRSAKASLSEAEELDEVSKATLGSYIKKANLSAMDQARKSGEYNNPDQPKHFSKAMDRMRGIKKATDKLVAKEEVDLDEEFKKGDTVKPTKGPHKGVAHEVIHDYGDGHYNIKPKGLNPKQIRYSMGAAKAHKSDLVKEEVEQLDELSPNTLHSYIKKAAGNMAGNAAVAAAQASSSMRKSSPDVKRKIKNRMTGITGASGRLADKANMAENWQEEIPMMMRQLEFIAYAAEEIMDYVDMAGDPEEWFQNKISGIHQSMLSMYAYAQGGRRAGYGFDESVELEEKLEKETIKHPVGQRPKGAGWVLKQAGEQTGKDHSVWERKFKRIVPSTTKEEVDLEEELKGGQKKLDHNKNGKLDAHDFKLMRAKKMKEEVEELDEISKDLAKSYYRKAAKDIGSRAGSAQGSRDDAYSSRRKARDNYQVSSLGSRRTTDDDKAAHNARADRAISNAKNQERKIKNRAVGMSRASTRMEEVEQIDEISQEKLRDYHAKSALDLKNKREKLDKGTLTMKDLKKGQNRVKGLNRAADKMDEEVEILDEAFKQGIVKLKDGSSVALKKEDADLLNQMFKDLSSGNRSKMQEIAMKDKTGFEEILGFAREAL